MSERILYYSTAGKAPLVDFREALFQGQPPDGGLYMPARIPRMSAILKALLEKALKLISQEIHTF